MVIYTVRCTFEDLAIADEWVTWLIEDHLHDVKDAGASSAQIQRVDGDKAVYEVAYGFPSRGSLDTYLRDHADRLRARGLERFPLEKGLTYERSVADVIYVHAATAPPPTR